MVRWSLVALLVITTLLTACSGQQAGGDEDAVTAADAYFTALADADYDAMAGVSTGLAEVAARYGQQVVQADPDAFGPRELVVIDPLRHDEGSTVLAGALELESKGLRVPSIRFSQITVAREEGGWLVASYARDGRDLAELFSEITVDVEVADVRLQADLFLTDAIERVLVLPVRITAGEDDVVLDLAGTVAQGGGLAVPVDTVEGDPTVEAGRTEVIALVFRDVPDPAAVDRISLKLAVGAVTPTVELPLRDR